MTATNITLILVAFFLLLIFFYPHLLKAPTWRATVTPLASIIGSGFLVAGPILAHAAGRHAWLAMIGLCAVAYLFGEAIRHNILYVEPLIHDHPPKAVVRLQRASELTLSLAYFVSVAYYLNLFAAFGLRLGDIVDPFWIRIAATAAISGVGIVGVLGGLGALEWLEVGAVGLKLSLIGGLFAALAVAMGAAWESGTLAWHATAEVHGFKALSVLMGLVILVQGFETSRYLGDAYDAQTRAKTMRYAQWLSTAIYVVFILLITSYFTGKLPEKGGETLIIDMLAPMGAAVAPLLIVAALASQLSAAIADTNGSAGLLTESFGNKINIRIGNLITAVVAIGITWVANIYEIIAYASKVFVLYYALQALQAALSARRKGQHHLFVMFLGVALIAAVIVVVAEPADA